MAIDYNDPVVAEELAKIQPLDFDAVEAALQQEGVPCPPSINDFDAKLMLVEVRLRKQGRLGNGGKPKAKKTTFSTNYEKYMNESDMFAELVTEYKAKGDQNAVNVCVEYANNPELALKRYGESYAPLIRQVKKAISMPKQVKSKSLSFSGFPANMGEDACKMTLEALGPIVSFECAASEDFPILLGKVEFEDLATAQKAVDQYNGMDMGMGTKLEMVAV